MMKQLAIIILALTINYAYSDVSGGEVPDLLHS